MNEIIRDLAKLWASQKEDDLKEILHEGSVETVTTKTGRKSFATHYYKSGNS